VNKKRYYGGYFDEQIEAAKRVNQLCDELGIPRKNPEVNAIPNPKVIEHFTVYSLTHFLHFFLSVILYLVDMRYHHGK